MTNTRLRRVSDVVAKQLESPSVRAEWDRTAPARAVALRLVTYRAEHGLTQTALGRILGMPQSTVARLESGERTPTLETLVRLSDGLNIEFLVDIRPADRRSNWIAHGAEDAKVVERVTTDKGGELIVAAS